VAVGRAHVSYTRIVQQEKKRALLKQDLSRDCTHTGLKMYYYGGLGYTLFVIFSSSRTTLSN
jgi:hypothetical protein